MIMATRVLLVLAAAANAVFVPSYPAESGSQSHDDRVVHLATTYCPKQTMQEGQPQAEALRQTKLSFINEEGMPTLRKPFFWAPFILVGDAD